MKIVTGYRGEPHITSEQDRAKNQGIFGEGSYVLNVGTKLRAELESGNEIRIHDGVISHQGCVAVIEKGSYDTLILANGTQGRQRIDLIVARYEKDVETEQESLDLVVIEGTPVTSDPVVPSYHDGDIQAGDILVDMPLYTVLLDGVQVSTITSVHEDLQSNEELLESTRDLADTKVNRAGDTMTGRLNAATGLDPSGSNSDKVVYALMDKDGYQMGLVTGTVMGGNSGTTFEGVRNVNGANKYNSLRLLIDANGDAVVALGGTNAAAAWRSAINAVNKAGDTMTGGLYCRVSNDNAFFSAISPQCGIRLHANGGNTNHGVWSITQDRWILYANTTDVFVNGFKFTTAADARTSLGLDSNTFKYKAYSYQLNVSAGTETITVTGTNLKVSTPSGYVPLAFRKVDVGRADDLAVAYMDATATGGSAVLKINNVNRLGFTITVSVTIIYVKNYLISAG